MLKCFFENNSETSLRHVCVDTLVFQNNKILLTKRAPDLLEGGKWGLIGGFMERDENLQQAVQREIMEETGYEVSNITLLTIRHNPDRPHEDRQNIAFVFFCEARKKIGEPDNESITREWFELKNIPPASAVAFDHYKNIELYQKYVKERFHLPKFE